VTLCKLAPGRVSGHWQDGSCIRPGSCVRWIFRKPRSENGTLKFSESHCNFAAPGHPVHDTDW
jgi:hypothetical protein